MLNLKRLSINKNAVSRGNGLDASENKCTSSPYAGITQVRFNGYDLRLLSHPLE
jgi:hypothetical protein